METKFNFNSQVATSRSQSERLLALGLKKETADMFYSAIHNGNKVVGYRVAQGYNYKHFEVFADDIPAWSLHRLIEMADTSYLGDGGRDDDNELWMCLDRCYCWNNHESFYNINLYGSLIDCIEWLIKEGYFNKEYLV